MQELESSRFLSGASFVRFDRIPDGRTSRCSNNNACIARCAAALVKIGQYDLDRVMTETCRLTFLDHALHVCRRSADKRQSIFSSPNHAQMSGILTAVDPVSTPAVVNNADVYERQRAYVYRTCRSVSG